MWWCNNINRNRLVCTLFNWYATNIEAVLILQFGQKVTASFKEHATIFDISDTVLLFCLCTCNIRCTYTWTWKSCTGSYSLMIIYHITIYDSQWNSKLRNIRVKQACFCGFNDIWYAIVCKKFVSNLNSNSTILSGKNSKFQIK